MWAAESIAGLALLCGISFLLLSFLVVYSLRFVEYAISYARRSHSNTVNIPGISTTSADTHNATIGQGSIHPQTTERDNLAPWTTILNSQSFRSLSLHASVIALPPSPSTASEHSPHPTPSSANSTSAVNAQDSLLFGRSGEAYSPYPPTPNTSDSINSESPFGLAQNTRLGTSSSSVNHRESRPRYSPGLPPSSFADCQDESSPAAASSYRRFLRRFPSFISIKTTTTTGRSLRTQPPCYTEDLPFNEVRIGGGPIGQADLETV